MKKILSAVLVVAMLVTALFAFSSCGKVADLKKITERGSIIVGYTEYPPMNYPDETGKLIGFDTEFAEAVAAELGVTVKFQLIDWDKKYAELASGAIDCIWNGFTSNCKDDDGIARSEKVDFSIAYMDNAQCVVVKSDVLANYNSTADLQGKKCAVEGGSAGATYAASVTAEDKIVKKNSQVEAFTELKAGAVDFIVVDVLLANEMCGKGDYANLAKVTAIEIEKEEYSIGFRKNSDLPAKINEIIEKLAQNGKLQEIADKYGLGLTEALTNMKTA